MTPREKMEQSLASLGPIAVAVSGGVDSMTLAVMAHRANPDTEMFHAISAAVPKQATARVEQYALVEGWRLRQINAGETTNPDYVANPANRCFYCKTNLYDTIAGLTDRLVLSGTNLDDLGDYRPGLEAAKKHAVRHPWVECQISKSGLRDIARELGLTDLQDLPAAPCLSSRVETGIRIDPKLLPVINETEQALWASLQFSMPIKGVRCRVRATGIALELETSEVIDQESAYAKLAIKLASDIFDQAGFTNHARNISVEPYRRGSAFLIETLNIG